MGNPEPCSQSLGEDLIAPNPRWRGRRGGESGSYGGRGGDRRRFSRHVPAPWQPHTCGSAESTAAEIWAPAHMAGMGLGHLVQKSPFQRPLAFPWAICLAFPPDARLAHSRLAEQFHLTADAHLLLLTDTGLAAATGMLRGGVHAVVHSDSSPVLCGALPLSGSVPVGLALNPKTGSVHTPPSDDPQARQQLSPPESCPGT